MCIYIYIPSIHLQSKCLHLLNFNMDIFVFDWRSWSCWAPTSSNMAGWKIPHLYNQSHPPILNTP